MVATHSHKCLFGQESEISTSGFDRLGAPVSPAVLSEAIVRETRKRVVQLPGPGGSGMFLAMGGRIYIDSRKLEFASPECCTPAELCKYVRALESILQDAAMQVSSESSSVSRIILSRCNISYGPARCSWACHESYAHRSPWNRIPAGLIPHLVSRLVYSGAGGFDNTSRGLRFMVSPRVAHITEVSSIHSTHSRGILHQKQEPLNSAGYHRLHILVSENLSSDTALALKFATTALILLMIDKGLNPGRACPLKDPLIALLTVGYDTSLKNPLELASGEKVTAIEIQRRYLDFVAHHFEPEKMPAWGENLLQLWRKTLEQLESNDPQTDRILDWKAKLKLFRNYARSQGLEWGDLGCCSTIIEELEHMVQRLHEEPERELTVDDLTSPELAGSVSRFSQKLIDKELDWQQVRRWLNVRPKFYELDQRFGELSENGIAAQLANRGLFQPATSSPAEIELAKTTPPPTRARRRGALIDKLASSKERCECDWGAVRKTDARLIIELPDPFNFKKVGRWKRYDGGVAGVRSVAMRPPLLQRNDGLALYDRGDYCAAVRVLKMAMRYCERSAADCPETCRYLAWSMARRGMADGIGVLDSLYGPNVSSLMAIGDYMYVYRFQGLIPSGETRSWFERGARQIAEHPREEQFRMPPIYSHYGSMLLSEKQFPLALEMFELSLRHVAFSQVHWRAEARICAEAAEAYWRNGNLDRSLALLNRAESIQRRHNCLVDLAEFTLVCRARTQLSIDVDLSIDLLLAARELLHPENRMVHVKIAVLLARIQSMGSRNVVAPGELLGRVRRWRRSRSSLSHCPVLKRIVRNWEEWITPASEDRMNAEFWGL